MGDEKADGPVPRGEHIVAGLPQGIAVLGLDGRVLTVNQALLSILGLERIEEGDSDALFTADSPLGQLSRRALAGELVRNHHLQYSVIEGAGRWLRVNTVGLDEDGRRLGIMLVVEEASGLKQTEREIWQVEKMSALGRLAASVAHEVCNPLGAIDIQLQLLQEDIAVVDGELAGRVGRRLDIARAEMRRLDGIVQNFLRFSRPPALHMQQVYPNDLLRHIFALAEPEAREREIDLVLELANTLPLMAADENQLSQALLNILINSFHAVEEGGRVVLKSGWDRLTREAILEIDDDGHGIDAESLERIFEFYYTTKDEGTGLGLSIAQRIVHQHGGTLEVDSQVGAGTKVSIRLPVYGVDKIR